MPAQPNDDDPNDDDLLKRLQALERTGGLDDEWEKQAVKRLRNVVSPVARESSGVETPPLAVGTVLRGKQQSYRLLRQIAGQRQSLSDVYEAAIGNSDSATCVLKLPRGKADSYRRFQEETERLQRLNCHWIIRPVDTGETAGRPFHVLPRLTGSLRRQMPVSAKSFETMAASLLSALHHLHTEARLFHGDVKPDNLLLASLPTPTGGTLQALVLTDLGSALAMDGDGRGPTPLSLTPLYAPAAARQPGFRWDARAELHCVAVTFCELLTASLPARDDDGEVIADGCSRRLAATVPTMPKWGPLLDRAVTGEYDTIADFYLAAERRALLSSTAAAVFESREPWMRSCLLQWLAGIAGGLLAGLLIGVSGAGDEVAMEPHEEVMGDDEDDPYDAPHDNDDPGHDPCDEGPMYDPHEDHPDDEPHDFA